MEHLVWGSERMVAIEAAPSGLNPWLLRSLLAIPVGVWRATRICRRYFDRYGSRILYSRCFSTWQGLQIERRPPGPLGSNGKKDG